MGWSVVQVIISLVRPNVDVVGRPIDTLIRPEFKDTIGYCLLLIQIDLWVLVNRNILTIAHNIRPIRCS